jgi:hypothetical protein
MKINTLIEHKESVVICKENGLVSLSYNVLPITPKANAIVKHVVLTITAKSTLTCTNCGKTGHSVETCENTKREVLLVPTTMVKSTKPIARTKTQLVKSRKIYVCYPCTIYFSIDRRFGECPIKIEGQNMFKTKPISSNATIKPKPPKTNNVPINVIVIVAIRSQ